jgi:hypothetical protein
MVAPIFTFERNIWLIKGLIDGREREETKKGREREFIRERRRRRIYSKKLREWGGRWGDRATGKGGRERGAVVIGDGLGFRV